MDATRRRAILAAYLRRSRQFDEITARRGRMPGPWVPVETANTASPAMPCRAEASHRLSERQHEILSLIGNGRSNHQIGSDLHISVETVKTHVEHILQNLGARNRAHAIFLASEAGLLAADPRDS